MSTICAAGWIGDTLAAVDTTSRLRAFGRWNNLRVCDGTQQVVPVANLPAASVWVPPDDCVGIGGEPARNAEGRPWARSMRTVRGACLRGERGGGDSGPLATFELLLVDEVLLA